MAKKTQILNNRKRTLYRKHIPAGEAMWGGAILAVLALAGVWFLSKANDFHPADRDISMAALEAGAVEDTLYRTPLRRWSDPSQPSGAVAEAPQIGLFPEAILDQGWSPASRFQQFSPENLYEKINGAADQYLQFGFTALDFLAIEKKDADAEISIERYHMGSFPNALGIFAAQRSEDRVVETRGAAQVYGTEIGAIALFGPYYLKLAATREGGDMQEKALALVDAIAQGTRTEDVPAAYTILSKTLAIPFDGIAYERNDVFQYDFAKEFWFGYPEGPDGGRYYLHEAKSEEEAAALFAQLLENNRYDYDVVEETETDAVFHHQFLGTFMSLHRRGNLVFGVDNFKDRAQMAAAAEKLQAAMANGGAEETAGNYET